jgi:ferredoxin-NADP reductase
MARAAVLGRLNWRLGEVIGLIEETPGVRTIVLNVTDWPGHRAGQHVDVRLTAADGYQAQRSYSIASAPGSARLMLTVERLSDGEVSPYLVDELRVGDLLELRGPIGGYFVWEADTGGLLLLLAGGSGIVPLMAMLRHRAASRSKAAARLIYSSRTWEDVIFRDELERLSASSHGPEVVHTLTRAQPPGWRGYARRLDGRILAETAYPPESMPATYVCGPTSFVEATSRALVLLGHEAKTIKTERFGPTGG